jgi:hypothetical protein
VARPMAAQMEIRIEKLWATVHMAWS